MRLFLLLILVSCGKIETPSLSVGETRTFSPVVVSPSDRTKLDAICEFLVQSLASASDGVSQVDGKGWFTATGELLVQEY